MTFRETQGSPKRKPEITQKTVTVDNIRWQKRKKKKYPFHGHVGSRNLKISQFSPFDHPQLALWTAPEDFSTKMTPQIARKSMHNLYVVAATRYGQKHYARKLLTLDQAWLHSQRFIMRNIYRSHLCCKFTVLDSLWDRVCQKLNMRIISDM